MVFKLETFYIPGPNGTDILRTDYMIMSHLVVFLMLPIIILGIIGNILITLVIRKSSGEKGKSKSSVNVLLLNLAKWDGIFLIGQILQFQLFCVCLYFPLVDFCAYYVDYYDAIPRPWYNAVVAFGQTGSIYTTLIITIERFIAVRYALHARRLCSVKKAHQATIGVFFIALMFSIPHVIGMTYGPWQEGVYINNDTDYPVLVSQYNELGQTGLFQAYVLWGQHLFSFVIPFIVLCSLNFLTVLELRKSHKLRSKMSIKSSSSSSSVSNMLVCVVAIFGICYFPLLLELILTYSVRGTERGSLANVILIDAKFYTWLTMETTTTSNSALNFIIYCLMGKAFRETFLEMLKIKKKKSNNQNNNGNITLGRKALDNSVSNFTTISIS